MSGRNGKDPSVIPPYTRKDFLRFDAASRGDNKDIIDALNSTVPGVPKEDVEDAGQWHDFASWKDYENLTATRGLEVLAWAIFNFAPCVVEKSRLPSTDKWAGTELKKWLSIDDIGFILITLENSINKWIRLSRKLEDKKRQARLASLDPSKVVLLKADMKEVPGTKFPAGSGVSGRIGQERFHALKLYLKRNYYDDTELTRENCKALAKELSRILEEEERKREERPGGNGWGDSNEAEAAHIHINPELDSLHDMEWEMYMDDGKMIGV